MIIVYALILISIPSGLGFIVWLAAPHPVTAIVGFAVGVVCDLCLFGAKG